MDSNKKEALLQKIETNSYETITLMQSLKWYLILTIDDLDDWDKDDKEDEEEKK